MENSNFQFVLSKLDVNDLPCVNCIKAPHLLEEMEEVKNTVNPSFSQI